MCITLRGLGSALAVCCLAGSVLASELQPRRELPKQNELQQPAYAHRLIVKFRDALQVRSTTGDVDSLSGRDVSAVNAIARQFGAGFSPLIQLPPATLTFLEERAAQASGVAQPDLAGMFIVDAPAGQLERLANELNALPATEFAYFQELLPPPPCEDIAPATPDYLAYQSYHGPDPGLNMTAAWASSSFSSLSVHLN